MKRQLKLVQVPHSSFYYKSRREIFRTASDERSKDEILEIYMEMPFYGVSCLTVELKRRGYRANHKRVCGLQESLNLQTSYPRLHFNISESHPKHKTPQKTWSTGITYAAIAGHWIAVIKIVD